MYEYLVAVIGPATKLHVTVLVIKGEPRNVYLACALEDARRNVQATAVMFDHNICLECPVETLISTLQQYTKRYQLLGTAPVPFHFVHVANPTIFGFFPIELHLNFIITKISRYITLDPHFKVSIPFHLVFAVICADFQYLKMSPHTFRISNTVFIRNGKIFFLNYIISNEKKLYNPINRKMSIKNVVRQKRMHQQ